MAGRRSAVYTAFCLSLLLQCLATYGSRLPSQISLQHSQLQHSQPMLRRALLEDAAADALADSALQTARLSKKEKGRRRAAEQRGEDRALAEAHPQPQRQQEQQVEQEQSQQQEPLQAQQQPDLLPQQPQQPQQKQVQAQARMQQRQAQPQITDPRIREALKQGIEFVDPAEDLDDDYEEDEPQQTSVLQKVSLNIAGSRLPSATMQSKQWGSGYVDPANMATTQPTHVSRGPLLSVLEKVQLHIKGTPYKHKKYRDAQPQPELRPGQKAPFPKPYTLTEVHEFLAAPDHVAAGLDILLGDDIPCPIDSTMPDLSNYGEALLVAANLHNSEALMPHFILQLLGFLSTMPPHSTFVSIYESGSTDKTVAWLEVLRQALDLMQVPNKIVVGGMTRAPGQERIEFLTQVRNAVLAPLYAGLPVDRIVFINDVYFCEHNLRRLLLQKGDLLCGMDFDVFPGNEQDPDAELVFYDKWVSRDAQGAVFLNLPPYVTDPYSVHRLHKGLPIPVTCCWNGLAVLNAEPFMQGVRFRMRRDNECYGSECSLMCQDFLRLGYNKFIIDPAVRQVYRKHLTDSVYGEQLTDFMPYLKWDKLAAAKPIKWRMVPAKPPMVCCDKKRDDDLVEWSNPAICHPEDIYTLTTPLAGTPGADPAYTTVFRRHWYGPDALAVT